MAYTNVADAFNVTTGDFSIAFGLTIRGPAPLRITIIIGTRWAQNKQRDLNLVPNGAEKLHNVIEFASARAVKSWLWSLGGRADYLSLPNANGQNSLCAVVVVLSLSLVCKTLTTSTAW